MKNTQKTTRKSSISHLVGLHKSIWEKEREIEESKREVKEKEEQMGYLKIRLADMERGISIKEA